jgi:hypothetical protein
LQRASRFFAGVTRLQRRRVRVRNLAIQPERIELAVKGGAPDAQPPRDFGHLTVVMRDSESDGLGFDVRERPHIAVPIEQPRTPLGGATAARDGTSGGAKLPLAMTGFSADSGGAEAPILTRASSASSVRG